MPKKNNRLDLVVQLPSAGAEARAEGAARARADADRAEREAGQSLARAQLSPAERTTVPCPLRAFGFAFRCGARSGVYSAKIRSYLIFTKCVGNVHELCTNRAQLVHREIGIRPL